MDLLDAILTSLVDSVFPIMRGESPGENRLPLLHLLNSAVYGQTGLEDSYDE